MALYVASFDVKADAQSAFDYVADFSNASAWDPSVSRSVKLGGGGLEVGTHFELDVTFLGVETTMVYKVTRWEPPHLVVLECQTSMVHSRDEITIVPTADGVHVTYAARLTLPSLLFCADPALQYVFDSYGDSSRDGLIAGLSKVGAGRLRSTQG